MKKLFSCLIIILITFPKKSFTQIKGDFYSIDVIHSILDFKVNHIGFGSVRGKFTDYEGTIYFDSTDILKTQASVIIKAESIDTGAEGRDGILKKEFFQVEKYPLIEFISNGVILKNSQLFLQGDLSMGAVSKKVEIPFNQSSGPVKDQFKHPRISFEGKLKVNRREYDLYYRSSEFWDSIISDSVFIEFQIGARVYNSLETVFPFRENSIGRKAYEAFLTNGKEGAKKVISEILENKDNYIISYGQMMRGATHLENLGNFIGASELVDLFLELNDEPMEKTIESEFLARKAKYLLKEGLYEEALEVSKLSLSLDQNTMALEVQRLASR